MEPGIGLGRLVRFGMAAAVLGFFTADREPLVGIGFGRDIVGIITGVRDQGLDILYIGAVGEKGHFGGLVFVIHAYFQNTFFMAKIFFDTVLAFFALDGGRLDHDGLCAFGRIYLGDGRAGKPDQGNEEKG